MAEHFILISFGVVPRRLRRMKAIPKNTLLLCGWEIFLKTVKYLTEFH